jgi:glycosyltransferase involved in cell wall biosynthesis
MQQTTASTNQDNPTMQPNLISVIIPTYDRDERMLGAALESVVGQSVAPFEVIVVDDGSATSVAPIVERFGDAVRTHHQQNGGIGSARNAGVAVSRGDMLAFLDSDDLWEPEKLARQWEALVSDPGLEAVFGRAEQFYDVDVDEDEAFKRRHPIKDPVLDAWLSSAMLIRRESFDRVGPFDEDRFASPDVDWYLRAREADLRVAMLPQVVYRRRIHATNINVTGPTVENRARLVAIKRSLDRRRASEGQS